jgi:hypothetical protein
MAILDEDLFRFLEAKGPSRCVVCGEQGRFRVNGAELAPSRMGAVVINLAAFNPSTGGPAGGHSFYSYTCDNCGFSYFHHVNQIEEWIKNNPKSSELETIEEESPKDGTG